MKDKIGLGDTISVSIKKAKTIGDLIEDKKVKEKDTNVKK